MIESKKNESVLGALFKYNIVLNVTHPFFKTLWTGTNHILKIVGKRQQCQKYLHFGKFYLRVRIRGTGKVRISIPKKVQVGKDQEKAQSERDSHSKNLGGKKPN